MNPQWKKKLVNVGWLLLAAGGMVLLVAAAAKKQDKLCAGIKVEIKGNDDNFFVDENEIGQLLNANGQLKGSPVQTIKLWMLEKRLENNKWIKKAELFVDNNQVLQVLVEENEPVARIFTVGGYSYYIDSSCSKLPLSERLSARVPMITNFPSDRARWSNLDSAYMAALKNMAVYINQYPFWKAQVAQIDVNANRELELVPTVGNHTIFFGKPDDYAEKFKRLFSFYKEVWTKVGLEKYEAIDVRFNGQVVAARKGSAALLVIDSTKARAALNALKVKMQADTGFIKNDRLALMIKPAATVISSQSLSGDKLESKVEGKLMDKIEEDKKRLPASGIKVNNSKIESKAKTPKAVMPSAG